MTFSDPQSALAAILSHLAPVGTEAVPLHAATGRVLAQPVRADRDSPPMSVSSMDGYAVRCADVAAGIVPVVGEVRIGSPPPALTPGTALRIVTGAPIPDGAEAVIRREDVRETPQQIILTIEPAQVQPGMNIRRRGENTGAGTTLVGVGTLITPAVAAGLAMFGVPEPVLHRRVKIGVLATGDELVPVSGRAEPWQVRDTNGPALHALLSTARWIEAHGLNRCADDPAQLRTRLGELLEACDAVLATGGVSMGDHDYMPDTVRACGGTVVFHKLPVRPGKPVLGAVGPRGQAIVALPGNPVSAVTTACRIAAPMLRRLGGFADAEQKTVGVTIETPTAKTLPLWWWRLVRLTDRQTVSVVDNQGSGDIPAMMRSDGFIEVPPNATGAGPWPMFRWEL